ncbi:MAG: hypothetical protein WCF85_20790 [Rhodospirillaceae bacterium]
MRDESWNLIRPLVFDQPAIFETRARGRAVRRLIDEGKTTKQTLYRLLRRYWQRGMTPNALLPDYSNCGAPGQERKVTEEGRRATSTTDIWTPVVDADTRSIFRAVVTRRFTANYKLDLTGSYEEMIRSYYSDQAIDERTGRQVLVPRKIIPTLRQFRYWFEKDNDLFKIDRLRRTPRVYDKDMRAILGTSISETIGPGSRYQIDATIADIFLVSRFCRGSDGDRPPRIIGRPVLYVVIDVFSLMIVGVYVGLEGPSWVSAMMALANAATDKVTYCRQFGIDITEADWPCYGVPDCLLGDTKILIHCALYYNNQHRLKEYPLCPEMIRDQVPAVPVELWNWGIINRSGRLRQYPPDLIRLSLLPHGDASVWSMLRPTARRTSTKPRSCSAASAVCLLFQPR